ncbi:MAG: nucleotidyl transferase AbiEii/AbiGii toxin family protein [Candidatus Aegiribacteria sp.]|nr:nucleotidyl transferase AbiEii/AbiGii toxin family protein [Candidatus Aegiribacteria sp.]
MDGYLKLPPERRRLICEQADVRLNLPASSLEKDYWVCWILRELFSIPKWCESITFKGGTSLSKCWGLINRFSEDIDIVIDRNFLGFGGEKSPENASSRKQTSKRLKELREASQTKIHNSLAPILKTRIRASLPYSDEWDLFPASEKEDRDRQTILFKYPSAMNDTRTYVRRVVKIEMGARSDNEPVEEKEVHPYVFNVFPDIIGPSQFSVKALAPERTFWEKAMLLHEETYRPADKIRRDIRMARHYYDLWCLITKGVAKRAVDREDIFIRTAIHREVYFKRSWMDYSTLTRGKLRVIPPPGQEAEWRQDYKVMSREMFFGEVPEFDEVLRVVTEFQDKFNAG